MDKGNKFGQIKQFTKGIGRIMSQIFMDGSYMNKVWLLKGNEKRVH